MRDAGATTRRRTGRTQPDAGLHRPRRLGIRMRLTLTYAGLVTTSGTVLIAMVYLYTRLVTFNIQFDLPPQGTGTAPTSGMQIKVPSEATRVDTNLLDLLTSVLRSAVVALVLLAVVSGTVGWVLAGRMLRPLSSMNAVANRAASGDLSQRLALSGPRDEIHDLADTFDRMLDSLERSFAAHRRFAADGTGIADDVRHGARGAFLEDDRLHARDDFTGFIDEDRVTDAHIQPRDIVLIVQGCPLDACSAELHGIEHCRRRNAPCPSDGQLNIAENRLLFLGRILVRNCPTWCLCRCTKLRALCEVVDLDDGTVDVVGKFPAPCTNRRNCVPDFIRCMADLIVCNDLDALCMHKIIGIGM